ncbi:uncharacterized protein FOMMEDRAFT_149973 [Fomitiporia mediterranea MF3/22]|uniref:uncharacterized protein n=1 Tax=Fomitiporia mediterranea (strain MF3/22) TaxID=694068 RepID=UPI0004408995|nr:uncharacterized protein FOMMEDRAFT_149973 [Fomitiporia mediterranea MF3/22]EJD07444.1 hypothetical protein FOMMEDRAFT_149973 [Fomitiporia mediterranea MF3/22]
MTANVLQAPFELLLNGYEYSDGLDASSPPSSPCSLYAVDSSPPSSPANFTLDLDASDEEILNTDAKTEVGGSTNASPACVRRVDTKGKGRDTAELETSPAHPYAASTRAVKRPPEYGKDTTRPKVKRHRGDSDPERDVFSMRQHARLHERDSYMQSIIPPIGRYPDGRSEPISPGVIDGLSKSSHDPEHMLWEETLAQAVDSAECKIDLSGQGLTYIPSKIADLSKLVVIHDNISSGRELVPRRTCSKSTNSVVFGAGKLGQREDEVHLFLARNSIAMLPNELFNLNALVVLSLRGNCLTEIPPLIGQLHNLRELNVANNNLRFLPSEILNLKLDKLAVDPNPFEENPYVESEPCKNRWFGPTERKFTLVPLLELALRVLLAPSAELYGLCDPTSIVSGTRRQETILEHCYDLPIQSDHSISPGLRETLSSCVPGSVASLQSSNAAPSNSPETRQTDLCTARRPCLSVCPSSHHLDVQGENYCRPVFVTHAEERLSWEKRVAGCKVGGEAGIPVRWRGCSAGCLERLEQMTANGTSFSSVVGEDDWSVGLDIDSKGNAVGMDWARVPSLSLSTSSKEDFKTFDSADIDLDD